MKRSPRERRVERRHRASSSPAARAAAWAASTRDCRRSRGKPMVAHVLERLAPQVDEVLDQRQPESRALRALRPSAWSPTRSAASPGRSPGCTRGLRACARTRSSRPCPAIRPSCPRDLVARLRGALERDGAELAVAKTGDQPHPVFCLVRRDVLPHLLALSRRRRAQDRRAGTRRSPMVEVRVRRRGRRVPQHQHARRARRGDGVDAARRRRRAGLESASDRNDSAPHRARMTPAQDIARSRPAPTTTTRTRCRSTVRAR